MMDMMSHGIAIGGDMNRLIIQFLLNCDSQL